MDYRCDWPGDSGDGTCGKPARWGVWGDKVRPVCDEHVHIAAQQGARTIPLAHAIAERKVPRMDPTSPLEAHDPVHHPKHYTSHPSGIECITIAEHFNFNLGNALKYLWRAGLKNGLEDLRKARWYLDREISRLEGAGG